MTHRPTQLRLAQYFMGLIMVLVIIKSIIICETAAPGARCSSVVRAFAHGAMGRRIDPTWGGPIELFLVPASSPRLV